MLHVGLMGKAFQQFETKTLVSPCGGACVRNCLHGAQITDISQAENTRRLQSTFIYIFVVLYIFIYFFT